MENQKKVVHFLICMVILPSCVNESNKKVDSSNVPDQPLSATEMYVGRIESRDGERVLQVRSINSQDAKIEGYYSIEGGTAQFTGLLAPSGDTLSVSETVDSITFRVVGLRQDEKRRIRNPYFFDGRMNCYYNDKINFYAYLDKDSPEFLLLGEKSKAELLGGHFVRVGDQIFVQGVEIDSADVGTFHTTDVFWTEKTEWSRTIGLDKNDTIPVSV